MRQVDRDLLSLRVAIEHPFERELAADAAFFVATIRVTRTLTETLVDLNPASLYRVRGQCRATRRMRRARSGYRWPYGSHPLRRSRGWRRARAQRSPRAPGASRSLHSRR